MGAAPAGQGDLEALDDGRGGGGVGGEGVVDGVQELGDDVLGRWVMVVEDNLGQLSPDVAPAVGEHAGARGVTIGAEPEEDDVEELVGEVADAVDGGLPVVAASVFAH